MDYTIFDGKQAVEQAVEKMKIEDREDPSFFAFDVIGGSLLRIYGDEGISNFIRYGGLFYRVDFDTDGGYEVALDH